MYTINLRPAISFLQLLICSIYVILYYIKVIKLVLLNLKDGFPFKFDKKYQHLNVKKELSFDITFYPP